MNNREIAQLTSRETYMGRPCKHGHNIRSTKSGRCVECRLQRAIVKQYKKSIYKPLGETQKVKQAEYHKKWSRDNKDRLKAYSKDYYQDNKERCDANTKRWIDENHEARKKYMREYRRKNLDKYKAYYDLQRSRAKETDNG